MNPLEKIFAAGVRKTGPTDAKPDGPMPRWPLHEDKQLGKYILDNVQAPAGSLSIKQSPILNAGSGLYTNRDVEVGELIFTSVPLVLCAEVGDGMEACDFCFQQRRRVFHPSESRFLGPGEMMPPLHVCNGCHMYQYCSKVSRRPVFGYSAGLINLTDLGCDIVLLATSLGYRPSVRVRLAVGRDHRSRDENTVPSPDSDEKKGLAAGAGPGPVQAGERNGQFRETSQENVAQGPGTCP